MTIIERVKECLNNLDCEKDSVKKVIALAYYMGLEKGTRETSNEYKKLIQQQRERAENCHYKHMANAVIGDQNYIYCSNYDMAMTGLFGNDDTKI